jgi:hypothetical protein
MTGRHRGRAVPCRHAKQVPHSDRLAARRRRAGQSGQMRQYGIIQAERTLALQHADRQRRHGLRHREHIAADVIDPAALPVPAIAGDDLNGVDAQPASVRGLPEPVQRGVESHRSTLLAFRPQIAAGRLRRRPVPARSLTAVGVPTSRLRRGMVLSQDEFDRADGVLASAQNQVPAVQQILTVWDGAHIGDSLVVQIGAALSDRAAPG